MSITKPIVRNLKVLMRLYKEKGTIRALLESGNVAFIRFSTPGHFYSPLPDLRDIESKSTIIFDNSATEIPSINLNEDMQIELAKTFSQFYPDLPFTDGKTGQLRYFLDNSYFSYGDGVILYSVLRNFTPKQVIEIGSGYSSALMLDINDLFLGQGVEFTFVEPFPDRLLSVLSETDKGRVNLVVKFVQEIDLQLFGLLEANDILFIDSSHVGKINSDVLHIIFHVLPRLKSGVIVHFHNILWPFEYPRDWLEEGRAWNEAYFLRAFLQANAAFEILYFNSFMALHHTNMLEELMPKSLKSPTSSSTFGNSSLWLRKIA